MAKLQVPPVYNSNESHDMRAWFKLLWKWVTDLYTAEQVDDLIEDNRVQLGTTVATTSGTAHDFTGIPSGTRLIIGSLVGVSTNGSSNFMVRLGDSGGVETTGYLSSTNAFSSGGVGTHQTNTSGFMPIQSTAAANVNHGHFTLVLVDAATFTWSFSTNASTATNVSIGSGNKSLSGELTTVRLTTINGTDTFDAGSVNIIYMR